MSEFNTLAFMSLDIWHKLATDVSLFLWLVPMIFLYEIPLMLIVVSGVIGWHWRTFRRPKVQKAYRPKVSCIIACYAEKEAVRQTIVTLVEQDYPGEMEIIAVVDGAVQNAETFAVAKAAAAECRRPGREIIVLPKWQRGGRVSTSNAGLARASGELVINADADTSFDNDMVSQIVPLFADPNVPAVGGALRVRNVNDSLWTRMQAIEYLISMQGGKTGLGHWNLLNNISGAFGAFRRDVLVKIGGWDTHTAEDLDLTLRLKQYFGRHPNWRIPFATLAIGHTDAPMDLKTLVWQRLRWDGDLLFLYFRKHWPAFSPRLLGGATFAFTLIYGVMQNVLMPFVILLYSFGIALAYPWQFLTIITLTIYLAYLSFLLFFYLLVLLAISERPRQDLRLLLWLPLYPFYALFMRSVSLFALINEAVRRSHEESSMAPWWVLKRGRKF
ncbi:MULTISPECIES: glycosyltransferase family 2 protein [Shewanella]|uniref:Glycosyltransferase n=1 Tax=Shewanella indica TaxID=768528 RepID=A0ABU4QDP5_9GAMM|nr:MULTISPECIES: glycosyltransferase [Shewanella]MDX6016655.1 glycosyltransferase [Shewanella indica]OIN17804.1 N-acetylglucosaminyltransferase [Shewanella algae]TVP13423.1 N-acetylglucosaminyltransferase [Shewanella sp. MSW]